MAIRWGVIGSEISVQRFEQLRQFLQLKGVINEFIICDVVFDQVGSKLKELLAKTQNIRIEKPYYGHVFQFFSAFPVEEGFLNYADMIWLEKDRWWLKSLLSRALQRVIINSKVQFNATGGALVIGTEAIARACVFGLGLMGFLSVAVIGKDLLSAQKLKESLKNHLFNVELQALSVEDLKRLPPRFSVVINTVKEESEGDLLKEVTFFNFILDQALLIDLSPQDRSKIFLQGSQNLPVHRYGAEIVDAYRDQVWLEQVFGLKCHIDEIQKAVENFGI